MHSENCGVCGNVTDFNRLASLGREAGYVATHTPDFLTLTKLSEDGRRILCYGVVHNNLSCELVVGCRDVSRHHLTTNLPVQRMMDLLLTNALCKGNEGFADLLEARRADSVVAVFRDANGNEVAREDGSQTVRHVNCLGFVEGAGEQCSVCSQYRGNLRKYRSREKITVSITVTGDSEIILLHNLTLHTVVWMV